MAQLDGTIARAGEDARTLGVAASLLALKAKIGGLERPQEVEVTHRLGSPLVDAGDDEMEWSGSGAPRILLSLGPHDAAYRGGIEHG
jgi:hypothetical protein